MDPTPRTPLRTEVKWGLGVVLVSVVLWVGGFFAFLARVLPL